MSNKIYKPENMLVDCLDEIKSLRTGLLPVYKEHHEPSYRLLATCLQQAEYACENVEFDKIEKWYEALLTFKS